MEREEILGILEGKEGSRVLVDTYQTPSSFVPGVYIDMKQVLKNEENVPDAISVMYRDSRDNIRVDDVLFRDTSLDIFEYEGQTHIKYTSPISSGQLIHERDDGERVRLNQLVLEHEL